MSLNPSVSDALLNIKQELWVLGNKSSELRHSFPLRHIMISTWLTRDDINHDQLVKIISVCRVSPLLITPCLVQSRDFKKMHSFSKCLKSWLFLTSTEFLFSIFNLFLIQFHLCCFLSGKKKVLKHHIPHRILLKPGGYSWLGWKEICLLSISKVWRNAINILYTFPTYISQEPSTLNINRHFFSNEGTNFPKAPIKDRK